MTDLSQLQNYFAEKQPMAIAVSGGVDSMTLAVVAVRANPDTEIFHAVSAAVPAQASARVRAYAKLENWRLTVLDAGEMADPEYLANPANRCYFCKTNLYDTVTEHTTLTVASGTNMDDLGDYRPGLIAAEEHQVCHPYVELGINKAALREIAKDMGLADLKDLPAAPCLSSRVTTGIAIDANLLPIINEVERGVWELLDDRMNLKGVRCRIRGGEVALQIESAAEIRVNDELFLDSIALARDAFISRGYQSQVEVVVIEPYERGSAFLIDTLEVK